MNWSQTLREGFVFPEIDPHTPLPDTVIQVTRSVEQHLKTSPLIRSFLEQLPKGPGTACPDSPIDALLRYVSSQTGAIDKSDPVVTLAFCAEVVRPAVEFEREQVLNAITSIKDVSADEDWLFRLHHDLARATDALWMKWFEVVATPYQLLSEEEKTNYKKVVGKQMAIHDYTVPLDYHPQKGIRLRISWAEAFSEEVAQLSVVLDRLTLVSDKELTDYFEALRTAYLCRDIDELEGLWRAVDIAWVKIPKTSRIIPVHGFESKYEHPFGVSPECRLEIRTSEASELIEERRKATLGNAIAMGFDTQQVQTLEQKLAHIDISVFVSAIRGGVALNFRYAGQALPNRQDVLFDYGGRIFLDQNAPERTSRFYRDSIQEHCTPETSHLLTTLCDAECFRRFVINHEFSHPPGRTKEIETALGDAMLLLEETKATHLGIQAQNWSDGSPQMRLSLVAGIVGRVLYRMQENILKNPTLSPYAREVCVSANTLIDTGVMRLTDTGVMIDVEMATSDSWFFLLREINAEIINAYKNHDSKALTQLTDRYCDMSQRPLNDLIKWVNRS